MLARLCFANSALQPHGSACPLRALLLAVFTVCVHLLLIDCPLVRFPSPLPHSVGNRGTLYGAIAVHGAHETSPTLDLPMWWTYACLAPGLALAGVVALPQAWMLFSQEDMIRLTGIVSDDLSEIKL